MIKITKKELGTRKIEAVIFDWAGTTVDYGSLAPVQAFIDGFNSIGIEVTVDEVRKPMGMLKIEHIKTILNFPRVSRLWQEKFGKIHTDEDVNTIYEKMENEILKIVSNFTTPKPYVVETVNNLRKRGIKIGSTTGYTDEMMNIVTKGAKEKNYEPDAWFSANSVNNLGRPYPYMVFENMKVLKIKSVKNVLKVGDTIVDIEEGINAGVITIGIIEGSSIMGYSQEEYNSLSIEKKEWEIKRVIEVYKKAGADFIINNMSELDELINILEG